MKQTLLFFTLVLFIFPKAQSQTSSRASWLSELDLERVAVDLEVFPNPATTHISLTDAQNVQRIVIYNLVGRQMRMFEDISTDRRYYVGDLPRGMYLIQLLGEKNKILTTKRISKQ
jgi:hypothetical protein